MLCMFDKHTEHILLFAFVIFLCRGGANLGFAFVYCIHIELFPANFVVTSFSVCNIITRCASVFAPVIAEASNRAVPLFTIVTVTFLASIASMLLRKDKARIMMRKNTTLHK